MGIVIRQSIYTSIISYAGVVIGYINLLYLYPKFLDVEQIGLLRTIQDAAILFVPFAQMGLAQSITRFYPHFNKSEAGASSFITMILFLSLIGFGIFSIIFTLAKSHILSFFNDQAALLAPYLHLVLWLTFLMLVTTLLETYSRSLLKVAFPNLLREVVVRLLQAILVSLYFTKVISFHNFLIANVAIYGVVLFILVINLSVAGQLKIHFDFSFLQSKRLREILQFSALSFVGTSSMVIIGKVDSLMVAGLLGFGANAIYTTAFYMATVIEIPKRAILQTTMPLIAEAFEKNDLKEIDNLYKKVSVNQLIIGALLLIGVWANIQNIFTLVPKGEIFEAGAYVVLLVGLGKLIDMFFGPSSEIIVLSKYYPFNIVVVLVLAVTVIVLNLVLIPIYGMTGAAIGSAIALFLFNGVKFIFIWWKFKLQPFTVSTLKVLGISVLAFALNLVLPQLENVFFDIFYRSALITSFFGSLTLISKSSPEVNKLAAKALNQIGWK
ncbi:MAG TPA: oligosaccharide flippase family protein [Cyclobacteriaceae bacterium]|nr:oligosaccharide flippase family protein [Cyclobacteriaceae bacterium]HRJ83372.1 oligosaccharide flippase family protein [Cyclobacteriaceae bacterium]